MRKIRPQDVVDDFVQQLDDLASYFDRIKQALHGQPNEKSDLNKLAEQSFVSSAVALEGFLSDIFLAFVNRDSSQLLAEYQDQIRNSAAEKYNRWIADRVQVAPVRHINVNTLQKLLDKRGRNVTFGNAARLKQQAQSLLAQPYRDWINQLNEADENLIDGVKAARDFIVHRSADAKNRMNDALQQLNVYVENDGLGRNVYRVDDVGTFLKALISGTDQRRIERFWDRVREIALWLRP